MQMRCFLPPNTLRDFSLQLSKCFQEASSFCKTEKIKNPKVSARLNRDSSLKDFTLVMVRPDGITNWALNANMLAHELRMYGGKTIVVQSENSDCKRSDFSKDVICIPQVGKCYTRILNLALSRISTKYLFFLDDPLRAMPSNHFVECLQQTRKVLTDTNIGYLGVGSKNGTLYRRFGNNNNNKRGKNRKSNWSFCSILCS